MPKKYWGSKGKVGISHDEENETVTLFAGDSAIELNGAESKICLSGSIVEMNGGDRTEEIFLRKNAGIASIIPSTTFTPIAQSTPNIPIGEITGLVKDIATMLSLLG